MADLFDVGKTVEKKKEPLTLKNTISGIKGFSPRVKLIVMLVGIFIIAMIFFAMDSMEDKPDASAPNAENGEAVVQLERSELPEEFATAEEGLSVPKVPLVPAVTESPQDVKDPNPSLSEQKNQYAQTQLSYEEQLELALIEKRRQFRERAIDSEGSVSKFLQSQQASGAGSVEQTGYSAEQLAAIQSGNSNVPITLPEKDDDPNKQKRKEEFIKNAQQQTVDDGYLNAVVQRSLTPFELKAGSVIPGVLQADMNSDVPGLIRGVITENIYDSVTGKYLLIPRGTRIVGNYDSQVAYGQERLLALAMDLKFPNGESLTLKGMPMADQIGQSGLTGDVDNHYFRVFGASFVMSVIAAAMQYSQQDNSDKSRDNGNPSAGSTATQAMAAQMGQTGMNMTNRNLNIQPTIRVKTGDRFIINVTKDIAFLKPYQQ